MHIKLVTYMRNSENFNIGLKNVIKILSEFDSKLECIVFSDKARRFDKKNTINVKNIVVPGTKYVRLLKLINEEEDSDCIYISIDNDMIIEEKNFKAYIQECIDRNVDFSWARLLAQNNNRMISKLVSVDKLLSHNIIRPLLWEIGVGISIPGQCFLIKPSVFKYKLYEMDTFLDDLALGIYVNEHLNELNVFISSEVIGYEFPNETIRGLYKQRKRWAKGFYQVLKASKQKRYYYKVCIHGIAYHGNWIINWIIIGGLLHFSLIGAVGYVCLIAMFITKIRKCYFLWGIVYQFVFPFFHMVWIWNLIKGEKNNGNG